MDLAKELKDLWNMKVTADHRVKIKKKKRQILESCSRAEKAVGHEGNSYTNCYCCYWKAHSGLGKVIGWIENQTKNQEHPYQRTVTLEYLKSSGDLRRLAVTQTSVKNHQLKLVWKTSTEENNDIFAIWVNLYVWVCARARVCVCVCV